MICLEVRAMLDGDGLRIRFNKGVKLLWGGSVANETTPFWSFYRNLYSS